MSNQDYTMVEFYKKVTLMWKRGDSYVKEKSFCRNKENRRKREK